MSWQARPTSSPTPFVVDHSTTVAHVGWQPEEWSETVARVVRDARMATAEAR